MQVDVSKIELEIPYKYKWICQNVLNDTPKTGHSKKAQLKELARYTKFRQEKTWFIFEEKYDTPKEKVDNRGKNINSLKALNDNRGHRPTYYDKELDYCIIDHLLTKSDELNLKGDIITLDITPLELMNGSYLINNNFSELDKKNTEQTHYAFNGMYKEMTDKIEVRCRIMSDYIQDWNFVKTKIIINDDNTCIFPNSEEYSVLMRAEKKAIKYNNSHYEKQVEHYRDIFKLEEKQKHDVLNDMRKYIREHIYNYRYHKTVYKITFNRNSLKEIITNVDMYKMKSEVNFKNIQSQFNRINKYRVDRIAKARDKIPPPPTGKKMIGRFKTPLQVEEEQINAICNDYIKMMLEGTQRDFTENRF